MAAARGWTAQAERGSLFWMKTAVWLIHHVPRRITTWLIRGICLYFWMTGPRARRSVAQYQAHLTQWSGTSDLFPAVMPVYRQFVTFGDSLVDRLDVWQGRLSHADIVVSDPDDLYPQLSSGRGQMLVGAHLGNPDVCRALSEQTQGMILNILVHDGNAVRFNAVMRENGDRRMRVIQVTALDVDTMMLLKSRIDQGEWLAVAGDRVPVHGKRTVLTDFLGHPAEFAQGPWLLAGLLQCPVNTFFCVPEQRHYRFTLQRLRDRVQWTRHDRDAVIQDCAQAYADILAAQCLRTPLQWFNFFPFWIDHA